MDNNFSAPIIKNDDKTNKFLDAFKNMNKVVVSTLSVFAILTISGSAFYIANYSKFSNNKSITSEDADAASVSCYLDLTLNSPTPSPVVTPTPPISTATPTPTVKPTASPTVKPTATATATPLTCVSCQYQSDLFYGPVITSFAGGLRYGNTRRIKSSAINTNLPACNLLPVSPQTPPILPVLSSSCADPVTKKYLVGKIDTANYKVPKGYLIGTITNYTKNCTYDVGFASYKAKGTNIDIQNLYDYKTGVITPGATIKFIIKSPANNDAVSCHNLP
jgi:hypothetical protein